MKLRSRLQRDFPAYQFVVGDRYTWMPRKHIIYYRDEHTADSDWALLHELGHATLNHHGYQRDIELLQLEVAAWDKATEIGARYGVEINWKHVEHCLDSYRDWLHARSSCPTCHTVSLQTSQTSYQCFNCHSRWQVSRSRLCRIHRRLIKQKQPL